MSSPAAASFPRTRQLYGSSTRIVRRDAGEAQVAAWYGRYQRLFIGDAIVRAVMELAGHRHSPLAHLPLVHVAFDRLREAWSRQGGYIETVSFDEVRSWLTSGRNIVAEAAPFRADGAFQAVGDCVYRLPTAGWVIHWLPQPPAEIHDRALYDTILEDGPQATALIDFLGVLPEWAHRQLAGDARLAGMREVRRRNLALPPERRIRHVAGMTFAVHGVEPLDPIERERYGPIIRLADLGQDPIVNRASMRAISLSRRCPARPLGSWTQTPPVPIAVDGRAYRLHVHWTVRVRSVEQVNLDQASADQTATDQTDADQMTRDPSS
jgi:hypothetical protein